MRGLSIKKQRQNLIDQILDRKLSRVNLYILNIAGYEAAGSFFKKNESKNFQLEKPAYIIPRIANLCHLSVSNFEKKNWQDKIITESLKTLKSVYCPTHSDLIDISELNVSGLNFEGVNLFGAILYGTNFNRCNMINANLQNSYLNGASFLYAKTEGMSIYEASAHGVHI